MNLSLISILGGTLFFLCFIIFKIVTSQSSFNINTKINNNNKTIKNSFNSFNNFNILNDNSVNIKNITNITVQSSRQSSYSNHEILANILIPLVLITIMLSLYNKYRSYINIFIIISLCLYLIFLGLHTYIKFNTRKMLLSLLFSIFLVSLLIYFYFYPLYTPENIELLYNSNNIALPIVCSNAMAALFILTSLATISLAISQFLQELFSLFVEKTYCYKHAFQFKSFILFYIIFLESGFLYKLFSFLQNIN